MQAGHFAGVDAAQRRRIGNRWLAGSRRTLILVFQRIELHLVFVNDPVAVQNALVSQGKFGAGRKNILPSLLVPKPKGPTADRLLIILLFDEKSDFYLAISCLDHSKVD